MIGFSFCANRSARSVHESVVHACCTRFICVLTLLQRSKSHKITQCVASSHRLGLLTMRRVLRRRCLGSCPASSRLRRVRLPFSLYAEEEQSAPCHS